MKSTNDQEYMPSAEEKWINGVLVLTLPMAIFGVALVCSLFV
ncbi:hypothetical protein AB4Z52_31530 [Rhizobium sp. 2YAF20]